MLSNYNADSEYRIVKEWFVSTDGINPNNKKFYGAYYEQSDPLNAYMVILEGNDAIKASQSAKNSGVVIEMSEIVEKKDKRAEAILQNTDDEEFGKTLKDSTKIPIEPDNEPAKDVKVRTPGKGHKASGNTQVKETLSADPATVKEEVGEMDTIRSLDDKGAIDNLKDTARSEDETGKPKENKIETDYNKFMAAVVDADSKLNNALKIKGADQSMVDSVRQAKTILSKMIEVHVATGASQVAASKAEENRVGAPPAVMPPLGESITSTGGIAAFPGKKCGPNAKGKVDGCMPKGDKVNLDEIKRNTGLNTNAGLGLKSEKRQDTGEAGFETRKTRRLHEDIAFKEPDILTTIDDSGLNNGTSRPKNNRKGKANNRNKNVQTVSTGVPQKGGIKEGTRVELKSIVEREYKYMNGLRGKVVAIDEGNDPIRVQLDTPEFGDRNGCVNVRPTEISIIRESNNPRKSESIEMAKYIASRNGVRSDSVIKQLGAEILEWANRNNIKEIMPLKEEMTVVFDTVLDSIVREQ